MANNPRHDFEQRDAGDWTEYTYFDGNGQKIQTVAYPKTPMFSAEALRRIAETELQQERLAGTQ